MLTTPPHDLGYLPKVAVIGGGIAGATASYYLLERNSTFGGRVASTAAHDELWQNVEAGAVAFSSNNWCMLRTASEVGFSPEQYQENFGQQMGVWNGESFILREDARK